jgi:putative phage-type endonuclease
VKTVQLIQGTEAWHQFRREKFTASDAAAMLGLSKYKSRNQLLEEKVSGATEEVTPQKQALFDKGHEAEAAARPIVEGQLVDDLFPATGVSDEWDRLAASFDGITMDEGVIWEHKLWNSSLADFASTNNDLPDTHWPQLEHQLYVSGANLCLFTVSDGTYNNIVTIEYRSNPERRANVLAGWRQFEADMIGFKPVEVAEKPDANVIRDLPALSFNLDRQTLALTSNLDVFKVAAGELVERSKKKLESDQDFSDAEAMVKVLKSSEEKLAATCENVLGQIQDVDRFTKDLREISELMRQARLALDKQVKSRKDEIKKEIAQAASQQLQDHVSGLNAELSGVRVPSPAVNFMDAMKNKRTIKSLHDSVGEALAAAKIEATTLAGKIKANMVLFVEHRGSDYHFLFRDLQELAASNDTETFSALVKQRIQQHENEQIERTRMIRELQEAADKTKASLVEKADAMPAAADAPANDNAPSYAPVADAVSRLDSVFADDDAEETITITMAEYSSLMEKAALLEALEAAGVDNWGGYSEAIDIMRDNFASED